MKTQYRHDELGQHVEIRIMAPSEAEANKIANEILAFYRTAGIHGFRSGAFRNRFDPGYRVFVNLEISGEAK